MIVAARDDAGKSPLEICDAMDRAGEAFRAAARENSEKELIRMLVVLALWSHEKMKTPTIFLALRRCVYLAISGTARGDGAIYSRSIIRLRPRRRIADRRHLHAVDSRRGEDDTRRDRRPARGGHARRGGRRHFGL